MKLAASAILFGVASLAGVAALATLAAPQDNPQDKPRDNKAAAETPLMQEMEKIDASLQILKRSVRDPAKNADSLAEVVKMESAALASKQMTPKMLPHVKEPERAKFVADYRKGMAALLVQMLELETALVDGDNARARELERKLEGLQTDGHNVFTEGE